MLAQMPKGEEAAPAAESETATESSQITGQASESETGMLVE